MTNACIVFDLENCPEGDHDDQVFGLAVVSSGGATGSVVEASRARCHAADGTGRPGAGASSR